MNMIKTRLKLQKDNNTHLWKLLCSVSALFSAKVKGRVRFKECLLIKSTINAGDKSNTITLDGGVLRNSRIIINGTNSTVTIGKNCVFNSLDIILYGDNSHCIIGDNVTFNSYKSSESGINVGDNTKVEIGADSLFSNSIGIYTTDFHKIFDSTGVQVNNNKSITIGKHVWVGMKSMILKGSMIPDGCVVGAGTIISGEVKEKNAICVGSASNIVRKDIRWEK